VIIKNNGRKMKFWLRWFPLKGIARRKLKRAYALIVLCVTVLEVNAVDITELRISENDGVYHIRTATVVDAPAEYVHRVLTDYVHIHWLNPSITESDILPSPGSGAVRVRTRIVDCIFVFCMELDRVEDVHEVPPYDLHTVIVPSLSNFRSGKGDWHIEEMGERSQVIYEAQMEPGFIIIPIIGPSFVKVKLSEGIVSSLTRIECIAKIQEELDWNPHLHSAMVDVDTLCSRTCDSVTGECPP